MVLQLAKLHSQSAAAAAAAVAAERATPRGDGKKSREEQAGSERFGSRWPIGAFLVEEGL
jgi:hypothetical protein